MSNSWKLLAYCGGLLVPIGVILMLDGPAYLTYGALTIVGMVIMAFASIYTIQIMSYIQITVPQEMIGKVIAWIIAVSTCAQPVGQMAYGFLFEKLSDGVFVIFYAAAVLGLLIAWYSRKASGELGSERQGQYQTQ